MTSLPHCDEPVMMVVLFTVLVQLMSYVYCSKWIKAQIVGQCHTVKNKSPNHMPKAMSFISRRMSYLRLALTNKASLSRTHETGFNYAFQHT